MRERFQGVAVLLRCALAAPALLGLGACAPDDAASGGAPPPAPVHVMSVEGVPADLAVDGAHLAIAARHGGVTVYDVATPDRPLQIASVPSRLPHKVLVRSPAVMAFDEGQGLGTLDLRSAGGGALQLRPALSTVELYGFVHDAVWRDADLVLASEAVGLVSYSVERGPTLGLNPYSYPPAPLRGVDGIAQTTTRLVATSYEGGLGVYAPAAGAATLTGWLATSHAVADVACRAELCYASGLGDGLFVYEVPDAGDPRLLQQLALDKAVGALFADEQRLYAGVLGPRGQGFYVLDLTAPAAPAVTRLVPTPSSVRAFARVGDSLYVLLEGGQLWIFASEAL